MFYSIVFHAALAESLLVSSLGGAAALRYITMAVRSWPYFISFIFRDNLWCVMLFSENLQFERSIFKIIHIETLHITYHSKPWIPHICEILNGWRYLPFANLRLYLSSSWHRFFICYFTGLSTIRYCRKQERLSMKRNAIFTESFKSWIHFSANMFMSVWHLIISSWYRFYIDIISFIVLFLVLFIFDYWNR